MRTSPLSAEQNDRSRAVYRTRRFLRIGLSITGLVAIGAISAAIYAGPRQQGNEELPEYARALARVTGANGGATGVAVSDSIVLTDAATFPTVGERVVISFLGGLEVPGVVSNVQPGSNSGGWSELIVRDSTIAYVGTGSSGSAGKVNVACVSAELALRRLEIANEQVAAGSTLGWMEGGCEGAGAVVFDDAGNATGLFVKSGSQLQMRFEALAPRR